MVTTVFIFLGLLERFVSSHSLGVIRRHASSALLKIPSFRLCDLQDRHLMLSLLVTVGIGWSLLISSRRVMMSVDDFIRLETCIHG